MDESTAVIRNQMDRTRADLSDQIDRLEHRVSENLFSTGEAVTDILGTVRETVRSVRHAADLRSHVVGHPWIAFGSAVALGYVATRLATRPKVVEAAGRQTAVPEVSRPATFVTTNGEQRRPLESQPQAPVRGGVRDILAGVLRDVAARGTPLVMDYLAAAIQAAAPPVWGGHHRQRTLPHRQRQRPRRHRRPVGLRCARRAGFAGRRDADEHEEARSLNQVLACGAQWAEISWRPLCTAHPG